MSKIAIQLLLCLLVPSLTMAQGLGALDDEGDLEVEITGEVVEVRNDSVKVRPDGKWRPQVGDPVRIVIGSGVVREVTSNGVVVDLQKGTTSVNMMATIQSAKPTMETAPPPPKVMATPPPKTFASKPPKQEVFSPPPPKKTINERPKWTFLSADEIYNTGAKHYQGKGVIKDYKKAFEWFNRAAGKGHIGALNDIGVMYELGQGVPRSPSKAVEWYRKAVAKNYPLAHYNLGRAYEVGNGVGKNYEEALKSFRRAARLGERNAQSKLQSRRQRW